MTHVLFVDAGAHVCMRTCVSRRVCVCVCVCIGMKDAPSLRFVSSSFETVSWAVRTLAEEEN